MHTPHPLYDVNSAKQPISCRKILYVFVKLRDNHLIEQAKNYLYTKYNYQTMEEILLLIYVGLLLLHCLSIQLNKPKYTHKN